MTPIRYDSIVCKFICGNLFGQLNETQWSILAKWLTNFNFPIVAKLHWLRLFSVNQSSFACFFLLLLSFSMWCRSEQSASYSRQYCLDGDDPCHCDAMRLTNNDTQLCIIRIISVQITKRHRSEGKKTIQRNAIRCDNELRSRAAAATVSYANERNEQKMPTAFCTNWRTACHLRTSNETTYMLILTAHTHTLAPFIFMFFFSFRFPFRAFLACTTLTRSMWSHHLLLSWSITLVSLLFIIN